jgi:hypothetical protein
MLRRAQQIRALRGLRAIILTSVAAAMGFASAGCAADHEGRVLERVTGVWVGAKPVRPGVELGMFYVPLRNVSKATLTIQSIGLGGPGIGRVAKVVEVKIATDRVGYRNTPSDRGTPSGLFDEDPPVMRGGNKCYTDRLEPVHGYRMTPGSMARIWFVVRALRPGRWTIPAHVIRYTTDGVMLRQSLWYRVSGSVASNARYIPVDAYDAKCIGPTGSRLLAGHHLPG